MVQDGRVQWLLPGQRPPFARWHARPFSPGATDGPTPADLVLRFEREVGVEAPGPPAPDGPHRRAADAILRYEAFPPWLIRGVLERPVLEVGDTVGVRLRLPLGMALFFAARVVDRFDGPDGGLWRTGFTYRTLAGHPELGEETFSVEKDLATGRVRVALRSWSRPGTWFTRLGRPAMRRLQRFANAAALDHLEAAARGRPDR
jgi:uncharacterized protein (UPF0548 family)